MRPFLTTPAIASGWQRCCTASARKPASSNGVAVRLPDGAADGSKEARALDAESLRVADLRLHSPTCLQRLPAKTGRSLEGAADSEDDEHKEVSAEPISA